jgi:hypothetical protein
MNTEEKVEGTLILDGLIEGAPPSLPEVEDDVYDWAHRVKQLGFPLSLVIEGNSLSLLAEKRPLLITELPGGAASPGEAIEAALNSLLEIFSPQERTALMSTIRSTEFRPGTEVQTIYAISPDGTIDTRQRIIDVETTPPPEQLSRGQIIRMSVFGGAVALVLLALTAGVIHLVSPEFWPNLFNRVKPLDTEELQIDVEAYAPYFTIEGVETKGRHLAIRLKRNQAFPTTHAQRVALNETARISPDYRQRLAADAVLRGYVTVEIFSPAGKYLSTHSVRIAGLADAEVLELFLPLPKEDRPARVQFAW